MKVNVVCQNYTDDRVLPRFARHLGEQNDWPVSRRAAHGFDVNFYMGYFEILKNKDFTGRVASYFTHLEADQESEKVKLYNRVAEKVWLRVAMNRGQLDHLRGFGPAFAAPLPLEHDHFKLRGNYSGATPAIGFSGYSYKSGRKGESMASRLIRDLGNRAHFRASGRGWPCETKMYSWDSLPRFFRSLDLFVCTSLVEGGPMTTLEAMLTGVPVVIPAEIGIHPQIPETFGVYRYPVGNYDAMLAAVKRALSDLGKHDRAALREATEPHSVANFCRRIRRGMEHELFDCPRIGQLPPWQGKAGIYVVAFGEPARAIANDCVRSIKKHIKNVPVAVCSDRPLGCEDVPIIKKDADIGGRIAKLRVFDYAPKEWKYILYVDADTEFTSGDPVFYFDLLADGWEFVICKDAHLHDTMKHFQRSNNTQEFNQTIAELGTDESLQINGGVWAFRRNGRTEAFFQRWFDEWAKYKGRDQGAFIRALYRDPIRVFWLCNEWNTLVTLKGHEYPPKIAGSAGIVHWVGKARRWEGQITGDGGLTGASAWNEVEKFERKYGKKGTDKQRQRPQIQRA